MPQSLAAIYIHIVFSTKERIPSLATTDLRAEMHHYLIGIMKNKEIQSLRVGGVEDHVHILCNLGRTTSLAELVKELKRGSTTWMKSKGGKHQLFEWQNGYAAFSVSPSKLDEVATYIDRQPEHHAKMNFQEELRRLLARNKVTFEEAYVWD